MVQEGQNALGVLPLFVDNPLSFDTLSLNLSGGSGANLFNVGIYTRAGVKVAEIGPTAPDGVTGLHTYSIVGGTKTISADLYLFVTTGNSNTGQPTFVTIQDTFIGTTFSSVTATAGAVLPGSIAVTPSAVAILDGSGQSGQPLIGLYI